MPIRKPVVVAPSPDKRNTEGQTDKHPPAVLTPPEWGVVLPFRWIAFVCPRHPIN